MRGGARVEGQRRDFAKQKAQPNERSNAARRRPRGHVEYVSDSATPGHGHCQRAREFILPLGRECLSTRWDYHWTKFLAS
jgi:hypothetical protein